MAATVCNRLSFGLLRQLAELAPLTNVFVSGPSLVVAALMVQAGAGEETRREILDALGVKRLHEDKIAHIGASLVAMLRRPDDEARLTAANGLWANVGVRLAPAFVETARALYGAQAQVVDFADPRALETINRWVTDATAGGIKTLLTAAEIGASTDCVLASAIDFKGAWETPFDPDRTAPHAFTRADSSVVAVPFMSRATVCDYAATSEFQAASLPYCGGGLSMEVLLPAPGRYPRDILASLTVERWYQCLDQLRATRLELALPVFKAVCAADMRNSLSALGIRRLFSPAADLSPMGLPGRFVGRIKHMVTIKVSEEGTEASAATAAAMIRSLVQPAEMRVDRPFFCAIRERVSGCLLFAGIIADPAQAK